MLDPSFSRFVTIHSRHIQQTDRQTTHDTRRLMITAELAMQLQRSAKTIVFFTLLETKHNVMLPAVIHIA